MAETSGTIRKKAPRNRTIELSDRDADTFRRRIFYSLEPNAGISDTLICGDAFSFLQQLPDDSFDLLFADPPYNLSKDFGSESFRQVSVDRYETWLDSWIVHCRPLLKETASVYICGDWRSSSAIQRVGSKYFRLQNRITWEREKGRGAKRNWKNTAEDIWFFTVSDKFTFNIDAVKVRRRVIAPYRENGVPKDWNEQGNFRDTYPSNLWTDLSVPFWSMPENTDHPTQKPEKLLAKIILASSKPGDLVLDPFAGSGTTAVVATKLGRTFTAIELDEKHCLIAAKRLAMAQDDNSIQGFVDGVFWERNSKNFIMHR